MNIRIFFISLILAVLMTSCVTTHPNSSSIIPEDKEYEVLGSVSKTLTVNYILGIIQWGKAGHQNFVDEARKVYAGTDDIIDITVDVEELNVAGIYANRQYSFTGTAIRYTE